MEGIEIIDGGGEEFSYVVIGAILRCSFGNSTSTLKIPINHGVYLKNKSQLNIMDFKPMINIMPFGECTSPSGPSTCSPVITMPWINGKDDSLIENYPALLSKSTNSCIYCGKITIVDDGQ